MGWRFYFLNYFHDEPDNFAPRFSFAYAPSPDSQTVLRGGTGIFYDRTGPSPMGDLLHFNGINLDRFLLNSNVPYPVGPAGLSGVPTSVVTLDPRTRIPYTIQYSLGVERQVTATTLSAVYVGRWPPSLLVACNSMCNSSFEGQVGKHLEIQ